MLDVQDLSFSYGPRPVLRGVCLQAQPGELLFVLGANGAGKTTLFRCILGLLPRRWPTSPSPTTLPSPTV